MHLNPNSSVFRHSRLSQVAVFLILSLVYSTTFGAEPNLCGAPSAGPATDAGLFLWEESCGDATGNYVVRAWRGGLSGGARYEGQITSTQGFSGVVPFGFESNDVLEPRDGGSPIRYGMTVSSPYQDGFSFSAPNTANVCFGVDLPAGTQVRVGPSATPVAVPFDLQTLGRCSSGSSDRFNVVVVLTDDHRWNTLWSTPSINDLASGGTRFSNAFVSYPVCGPVRASMLAGGFRASNTGIISNNNAISPIGNFNDRDTLAVRLQQSGYRTFFIGKYLNGYASRRGYVPPGWSRWVAHNEGVTEPWYDFSVTVGSSGEESSSGATVGPIPQYVTEYHRDEILAFLNDVGSEPFFIFWAAYPPHEPATPAQGDESLYSNFLYRGRGWGESDLSDKPAWVRNPNRNPEAKSPDDEFHRDQLRSLRQLDRSVAEIVDRVEAMGMTERTVFFVVGDNGYQWGEHGLSGKGVAYEESLRVPLVAFGGGVAQGVRNPLVLADLDLGPTISELAGLPADGTDGLSLLPFLRGQVPAFRSSALFESWGNQWDGPYGTWAALRTNRWKYIEQANGEQELYDLSSDPFELQSLHGNPSYDAIRGNLQGQLGAEKSLAMRPFFKPPTGRIGVPYAVKINAWGGSGNYRWIIESGSLPPGLQLDASSGRIEGTPTTAGYTEALIRVEDGTTGAHSGLPRSHKRLYGFTIQ